MTEHTITAHGCSCGAAFGELMGAELHASDNGRCTSCLGSAAEPLAPGLELTRPCTACAGTGRRRDQINWQLAHTEAEQVISLALVRGVVEGFSGPFHLSEIAGIVRDGLGLPAGRMPVGPRVRDLLLELQAHGEIAMLSAPDELLDGTEVVLYRDPQWQRARTLGM